MMHSHQNSRVGGITVPFDILAEFLPSEQRGSYLLLIEYFWTLGSMFVPIVAYYTLEKFDSWRIFVAICALPCVVSLVAGIICVPESPHWLVLMGKNEEALNILRKGALLNGKRPEEIFPHNCQICDIDDDGSESGYSELLKPKWRKIVLLLSWLWFGQAICYYGTIMAITRIFGSDGSGFGDGDESSFDYKAIFISSSAEIVGVTGAMVLVDRIGRIPVIVGSYIGGCISVFLLCIFAGNMGRSGLVFLSFCSRIFEMSGSCSIWISTSEILSTEIRSSGHAAVNGLAKVGGFISPFLVSGQLTFPHLGVTMLVLHIGIVMAAACLPETKGVELGEVLSTHVDRPLTPSVSVHSISEGNYQQIDEIDKEE
jgi:hypothetical protein